jgi:4,5-dihydroxyphthalate decarboxylase
MLEGAYDVAEMSIATFVKGRADGRLVVSLPVFLTRRFTHGMPNVRIDSDIWDPAELKGKKVGMHVYWQSAAIWMRSVLRRIHGVEPKDITWITSRPERLGTKYPPGVEVRQDRLGRDTARMLLEGEVDAVFGLGSGGRDRPEMPFEEIKDKRRYIYRDIVEAQRSYYRQTGVFPIMHVFGIREEIASKQPWIVESLYEAFVAAKKRGGVLGVAEGGGSPVRGGTIQDAYDLLGEDPFPYNIRENRRTLETYLEEAFEQGFVERRLAVEDLLPSSLPEAAH